MTTIAAKHLPYENGHLGEVVADMRLRGAPTIRVVEFDGSLCATEGSHRIAAAHHLGLIPKVVIEPSDGDSVPVDYLARVRDGLPMYEFDHVLALDLSAFLRD